MITDLAPECPFCGYDFTVPAGEFWHCYMCDSDFDDDGEVVIEADQHE